MNTVALVEILFIIEIIIDSRDVVPTVVGCLYLNNPITRGLADNRVELVHHCSTSSTISLEKLHCTDTEDSRRNDEDINMMETTSTCASCCA